MTPIIVRLKNTKPGFVFYWKDMIHVVCNQNKTSTNNGVKLLCVHSNIIMCFCPLDNNFYAFEKSDKVDIQTRKMIDE